MTPSTEDRLAEEGLRVGRLRPLGNYHVIQGGTWKVAKWEPSRLVPAISGHWYIAGIRRSFLDGELDEVGPSIRSPDLENGQPTEFERELVAALRGLLSICPANTAKEDRLVLEARRVLAKATERGL